MALSSRDLLLKSMSYEREEDYHPRRLPVARVRFRRDGATTRIQSFDEWGEPINGDGYF